MGDITKMIAAGDYVELPDEQNYRIYFNQIRKVCAILQNWAESNMGNSCPEGICIQMFGDRILQSIELLYLKFLADKTDRLKLDLNESGFPHFHEISKLQSDAKNVREKLKSVPPKAMAKEDALNRIFGNATIPKRELRQIGRRTYLEALKESDFMGPFSFGELKLHKETVKARHYICSWSCYNVEDNLIYLHLMEFEQSGNGPIITKGSLEYDNLLRLLSRQGRRVSPLVVLASEIDEAFPTIHPKVIRRMRVGPVLSSRFSFDNCELSNFLRTEGTPEDVVFSLESEVIVSSRQVVAEKGWLFLPDTLREVYDIDADDMECFDRKVTELNKYIFMPHHLWQQTLSADSPSWMLAFEGAERIGFDTHFNVYSV